MKTTVILVDRDPGAFMVAVRVAVMVLLALCVVTPSVAQSRLEVVGTVQWATATRIQVMSDANVSVSIDVSRLNSGSYPFLRGGNRVRVIGFVSPDGSRLIAESVEPAEAGGGYWNLFPSVP
jgi:hypothetical protein